MNGTGETIKRAAPVRVMLALALLALCLSPGPGPAQPGNGGEKVADVIIVGTRTIAPQKVLTYVHTRKGMNYSYARAQEDVGRLAGTHMFKNIQVRTEPTQDGRIIVYFVVQEHPNVVREVIYKHAKHISDKELDNITQVRKGMPLDKTRNQLACYELEEYFRKKGRLHAHVTLEEGFDEAHSRVVFNITEGPVVRVRNIRFVGDVPGLRMPGTTELADAPRLRTQIDTGKAFLGMLGGTYQPGLVDNDVLKLEEYYHSNGYFNARVSKSVYWSDDFQGVDVEFHVREGPRFKIKNVNIEGTKDFPGEKLATVVRAKKEEYYNEGVVAADLRNLTDYGGWRGYQLKTEKVISSVPGEPGVVNVQYVVEQKPPMQVGQIYIVGNEVTKDNVIRRALGILPGQTLRYPELRIAERNLARLNIFEANAEQGTRPTITPVSDGLGNSAFQDLLVQVKETHTGSLMLGAGVNSSSGLVGSFVINERNFDIFRPPTSWADIYEGRAFRGGGQEFNIQAMPGTQLQRYTVTFREPFLFDRPYSLTTSGYYYNRVFNEYTENRYGGRFGIGHQLAPAWSINGTIRVENVRVSNIATGAPDDYTSVQGDNFIVGPSIGLTWDTRDSFMRPTEGGLVNISYEQVLGDFIFPIFNVAGSRYFTVTQRPDGSGKQVLMAYGQTSVETSNAPVFERFFAGGYQSFRGFAFRGVGPNVNGYEIGGHFQFLNTLEYQVPLRANDQLYAVAFLDGGTVERDVSIHNYRLSAGVGLRISLPMFGPVPLALDFGFPINRATGDHTQAFQFSVGVSR